MPETGSSRKVVGRVLASTGGPWDYAWFLIGEIEETAMSQHPIAMVHKWDSAVRLFRQMEERQLFEQEPQEIDLRNHEALLFTLIGRGQRLQLLLDRFTDSELAALDINKADLAAYIQELKDTYLSWHGPELEPERKAELQQKIFGGSA